MGKKIDEAEIKKECPSCGLGVALDATVCEFCGWDFEEEDEWILQIEKLERDLMLEKQKFEPGTVEDKIEFTLHTPALERIEQVKARQEQGIPERAQAEARTEVPATEAPARRAAHMPSAPKAQSGLREARAPEMQVRTPHTTQDKAHEMTGRPAPAAAARAKPHVAEPQQRSSQPKVRRVRTLKTSSAEEQPKAAVEGVPAKSRLVRKVKQ